VKEGHNTISRRWGKRNPKHGVSKRKGWQLGKGTKKPPVSINKRLSEGARGKTLKNRGFRKKEKGCRLQRGKKRKEGGETGGGEQIWYAKGVTRKTTKAREARERESAPEPFGGDQKKKGLNLPGCWTKTGLQTQSSN